MYDLVLKNGTIVDGKRNAPYVGDLAITGGKIAAIGKVDGEAKQIVDVSGLVVSPGFIDMHSHSDVSPMLSTDMASKLCQGVTTEVVGNCGVGMVPACDANRPLLPIAFSILGAKFNNPAYRADNTTEYKEFIEANARPALNLAPLIGHGAIRSYVVGLENREPNEEELEKMKALLDDELSRGAWGMTLGLIYPPGIFSRTRELIELSKVVAKHGKILTVHMRNEATGIFEALDEMLCVARESGVHLHISHLKLYGAPMWHTSDRLLQKIADAQAEGLYVTADQYPYTASSTALSALLPKWASAMGATGVAEAMADPEQTKKLLDGIVESIAEYGDASCVQIASTGGHFKEAEGHRLSEIAQMIGATPQETVLYMLGRCQGQVACVYHAMSKENVLQIMQQMYICVGSDGVAYPFDAAVIGDAPHPRNFATFPRFLQTIRENQLMPLEDAVYKMTGLTAKTLGLTDRGTLEIGSVADITVFDYEKIEDRSTYTDPIHHPAGICHVLVGGNFALRDGKQTDARDGSILV